MQHAYKSIALPVTEYGRLQKLMLTRIGGQTALASILRRKLGLARLCPQRSPATSPLAARAFVTASTPSTRRNASSPGIRLIAQARPICRCFRRAVLRCWASAQASPSNIGPSAVERSSSCSSKFHWWRNADRCASSAHRRTTCSTPRPHADAAKSGCASGSRLYSAGVSLSCR